MIFTQIEDEANISGKRITNVFEKVAKEIDVIFNSYQGVSFSSQYNDTLTASRNSLRLYRDAVKNGSTTQEAFNLHIKNASPLLQEFVKTSKQLTPDAFEKFANINFITDLAKNKSLGTVKTLLNEYNSQMVNCKLSQTEFIEAVSKSNAGLGTYLKGLNGAKASMTSYVKQLFTAKAATIGMQIATTALNAAITFGISALISFAANAISEVIHYEEKLIEKSQEAANTIESLFDKFENMKKTVSDSAQRFAELAQGVNLLTGENKNLSTEEYEEFLDISNQLAETFPSLSRVYDDNGNVIVQLTGDVDSMVASLEALLEAERQVMNQEIAKNLPDLFAGVKVQIDDFRDTKNDLLEQRKELEDVLAGYSNRSLGESIVGDALSIKNASNDFEYFNRQISEYLGLLDELGWTYEYVGKTVDETGVILSEDYIITDFGGMSEEEIADAKNRISYIYSDMADHCANEIATIDNKIQAESEKSKSKWNSLIPSIISWLSTDASYQGLNSGLQGVVQTMVNNIDFESMANKFNTWADVESYIRENIIDKIDDLSPQVQQAFADLFSIKTDSISTSDYLASIRAKAQEIADKSDFTYDEVLKNTGYQEIIDQYTDSANKIIDSLDSSLLNDQSRKVLENKVYSLKPDELINSFNLIRKYGIETWDELEDALKRKTFEIPLEIDVEAEGVGNVSSAIEESISSVGLSSSSISNLTSRYKELSEFDPSKLFENTAMGIRLNSDALNELESAYKKQNKQAIEDKLYALKDHYDSLSEKIKKADDTVSRADLYAQRDNILDQIHDTVALASSYNGLTSAFNTWQRAQESGEDGDMYDSLVTGYEEVQELYKNGLIGTDAFRSYVDVISGQDLSTAPVKDVVAAYEALDEVIAGTSYTTKDFLSEGYTGCYNFLDAVQQLNSDWAHMNEDGSWEINFGTGNDQEIANALGIDIEFLEIILQKLKDFGFDINLDSEYAEFEKLKSAAEEANQTLVDLGKINIGFDFNTTDLDLLNTQINQASELLDQFKVNGEVDLSIEGAAEAQKILETLLLQAQNLDNSDILKFDMSNATTEVEKGVLLLQDFKAAYESLGIKQKVGLDTTEASEKLTELYVQLDSLPAEIKPYIEGKSQAEIVTWINSLTADQIIEFGIDPSLVEGYSESEITADGEVIWRNDLKEVEEFQKEELTAHGKVIWENIYSNITPKPKKPDKGKQTATGTSEFVEASVSFADGKSNNSLPGGQALGGEEGAELLVRDGKFYIIGKDSAEIFDYKKDDIIFDANQTEQILSKGKITNGKKRGIPVVGGKAFSDGNSDLGFYIDGETQTTPVKVGSTSNKHDVKDELEVFDWIEVAIEKISSAIDKLKDIASSAYKSLKTKLGAAADAITLVNDKIKIQQAAYERYLREAESINLADDIKQKVQVGDIDLVEYDEDTQKLIKEYQDLYEKSTEAKDAIADLHEELSDLYKERFDNIQEDYNNQLEELEHLTTLYESELSDHKNVDPTEVFDGMVEASTEKIELLEEELKDLEQAFADAMASGLIEEGSDAWYEMRDAIHDVNEELIETREHLAELVMEEFEGIQDDFDNKTDILDSAAQQIENEIELLEAKGQSANEEYYKALQDLEKQRIDMLEQELADLEKTLEEGVASGDIEAGSDAWYEMQSSIADVKSEIQEANIALEEYNQTMREMDWEAFDKQQEALSDTIDANNHQLDLLDHEDHIDENGNITSAGNSAVNLHSSNYNAYMKQANAYAEEIKRIDAELANDPNNEILLERRKELLDLQRDSISAAEDEKQAIKDLNEEAEEARIEAEEKRLEALREAEEKRIEAMKKSYSDIIDENDFKLALMDEDSFVDANGNVTNSGYEAAELHAKNYETYLDQARSCANEIKKIDAQLAHDPNNEVLLERREELLDLQRDSVLAAQDEKEAVEELKEEVERLRNEAEEARIDALMKTYSDVIDENDFNLDLMDQDGFVDEGGNITDSGYDAARLHADNFENYMERANACANEIQKIDAQLANDPNNEVLLRRREELLDLQRDSILAAKDEKEAIEELKEEAEKLRLEAMQEALEEQAEAATEALEDQLKSMKELIDSYTDVLDNAKD